MNSIYLLHPHMFLNFFEKSIQVHLSLKLLVAHLGARSYTEAAAKMAFDIDTTTVPTVTAQAEREMDLQLLGVVTVAMVVFIGKNWEVNGHEIGYGYIMLT